MQMRRLGNVSIGAPAIAVWEIGGILVGLLALEWMLPGPASLASVSPHPLWLPILLAAVQYGTMPAVLAVVGAASVYVLSGLPPKTGVEDFYTYWLRIGMLPILWFPTALLLGQLANRRIDRIEALTTAFEAAQRDRSDMAAYCERVMTRATEIDRRLALVDHRALETAFEQLARLHSAEGDAGPLALRRAMISCFGPCEYSVYLRTRDEVVRLDRFCSAEQPSTAASRLDGRRLLHVVRRTRRAVSVLDLDGACPDGFAILAPILVQSGGRIVGLIGIESIEPARLTAAAAHALDIACHAVAPAIERIADANAIVRMAGGDASSDKIARLKSVRRGGGA